MKIWIATGGTGGHIFPALAVAEELIARGHRVIVSSDSRGMKIVKKSNPPLSGTAFIWASGVGGKSRIKQVFALMKIALSASALVMRWALLRPDRVVAFGGYSSVPAVLAARIWKIPTLLHEQNAAIGRANKFAMRWVDTLMTSFPSVYGIPKSFKKVVYTGLPVRKEFTSQISNLNSQLLTLLITGGSLGAQILDDVAPIAIADLPSSLKKKLFVVHQTRPENVITLRKTYESAGVRANVLSFIHDMADQMSASSLIIGRSGASTVAELQVLGRPAILVPLVINPDQVANAEAFAAQGSGFCVMQNKFTPKWLNVTLTELFENPARLAKMAEKAKVPNDAVNKISAEILK